VEPCSSKRANSTATLVATSASMKGALVSRPTARHLRTEGMKAVLPAIGELVDCLQCPEFPDLECGRRKGFTTRPTMTMRRDVLPRGRGGETGPRYVRTPALAWCGAFGDHRSDSQQRHRRTARLASSGGEAASAAAPSALPVAARSLRATSARHQISGVTSCERAELAECAAAEAMTSKDRLIDQSPRAQRSNSVSVADARRCASTRWSSTPRTRSPCDSATAAICASSVTFSTCSERPS
jgi:hypothetical protein